MKKKKSEYLKIVMCHPNADVIEEIGTYCILSEVCQVSQGHTDLAVHEQVRLGMPSTVLVIHGKTS